MRELIIVPVVTILLLGLIGPLADIAESSSDKSIAFAGDMENAMDCAFKGYLVGECSPGLFDYSFEEEIDGTLDISYEMLRAVFNATNTTGVGNFTLMENETGSNLSVDMDIIEDEDGTITIVIRR